MNDDPDWPVTDLCVSLQHHDYEAWIVGVDLDARPADPRYIATCEVVAVEGARRDRRRWLDPPYCPQLYVQTLGHVRRYVGWPAPAKRAPGDRRL